MEPSHHLMSSEVVSATLVKLIGGCLHEIPFFPAIATCTELPNPSIVYLVFPNFGFNGERTPGTLAFAEEPCGWRCLICFEFVSLATLVLSCRPSCKIIRGFTYVISLLNRTLVFAWCLEKLLVTKGHQKDRCQGWIRVGMCSEYKRHSRFNN